MKLKVKKQELQEKLANIQNIVEKRNTMPMLSNFLLDAQKSGSSIIATDLETAIKEPIEMEVETEGKLCIPARKLFEIVKEVDGDISMESEDAQWIRVKAGASNFRLACLPPEEYPVWPALEDPEELKLDSAELAVIIEKTVYAAGESDTRYTLNGLLFHIEPEAGLLTVVGTDGHRMALIKKQMDGLPGGEKKVIIPRKAATEVGKFLEKEGEVTLLLGKNHVLFKIDQVEFLARLIEGTYPNYTQVMPSGNDKILTFKKDELTKALRRVNIMSRDRSNAVKLDVSPGKITLTSSNPELGEASDEVVVAYEGEELSVGFNARYLLDALNSLTTETVTFELQDQLSPTLLKEEGSDEYNCVVMPMRI